MWGSEKFGSTENHGFQNKQEMHGEISGPLYCRSLKSNLGTVTMDSDLIRAILSAQNTLLTLLPICCIPSSPTSYKFFRSQLEFHYLRPSSQPLIKLSLSPFHFSKESAVPLLLYPTTLVKLFIAAFLIIQVESFMKTSVLSGIMSPAPRK